MIRYFRLAVVLPLLVVVGCRDAATGGATPAPLDATVSTAPLLVVATGNVPVPYTIDGMSGTFSIIAEVSTDGGAAFRACTPGPGGEPTTGLSVGAHVFVW